MYLKDQLQRELAEMLADYEGTVIMVSTTGMRFTVSVRSCLLLIRGRLQYRERRKRSSVTL